LSAAAVPRVESSAAGPEAPAAGAALRPETGSTPCSAAVRCTAAPWVLFAESSPTANIPAASSSATAQRLIYFQKIPCIISA
jgi:hypothetical protein